MTGSHRPVPGQGEVLANGPEAGEKRLGAPRVAKSVHLSLTPARGLMAVFRAVIYPCASLHEDMLHTCQFGHSCLRRRNW
jgi:hypothetical protein